MTIHRGRGFFTNPLIPFTVALILLAPAPVASQGSGRIWGLVETTTGQFYEGFIRWDGNEGSWVDLLNGTKDLPDDAFRVWNDSDGTAELIPDRVIEIEGVRITFPDSPTDFVNSADSGVRLGHIERLVASADEGADVFLRSGQITRLTAGGATDLGVDLRDIIVEEPGKPPVELEWEDFKVVFFREAPAGAQPLGQRLHGTVEDRSGNRYTGFVVWDTYEILTNDTLTGETSDGSRRGIPFGRVAAIEPTEGGRK